MWGNQLLPPGWFLVLGSIPTHVGKPSKTTTPLAQSKVYPHACGETSSVWKRIHTASGLSPRMWGNHRKRLHHWHNRRSIPTHVGKPAGSSNLVMPRRVYPHACGETYGKHDLQFFASGLSPRMWGNHAENNAIVC